MEMEDVKAVNAQGTRKAKQIGLFGVAIVASCLLGAAAMSAFSGEVQTISRHAPAPSGTLSNHKSINVTFDGRSLIIDGERRILFSGSIHYPRSTTDMWRGILQKTKAAGVDVVETYVFWNIHQPTPDALDFGGNKNLFDFLELCQEEGLYVNLRIGPYVCAEWNFGGFPEWLKRIAGIEFRTINEPFQTEMEKWTRRVVSLFRPYFASEGGPIILAQIENEYGNIESQYGPEGHAYAEWAIQMAQSLDTGIPWIMCQQNDIDEPNTILTCNGFYCDQWVDGHWSKYPNTPAMWTENWPGWFQHWGEPLPTRPAADVAFAVARFIAYGGSLMNYYMWHGGTNWDRWVGGPNIVTSYDYDVALDEFGMPQEPKYSDLNNLHSAVKAVEQDILSTHPPTPEKLFHGKVEVHRYPNGVTFYSNIGDDVSDTYEVEGFTLPPWSVTIVKDGKVLINTASNTPEEKLKRSSEAEADPVTSISSSLRESVKRRLNSASETDVLKPVGHNIWFEPQPDLQEIGKQSPSPPEQYSRTHDKSDYLWHHVDVDASFVNTNDLNELKFTEISDFVTVFDSTGEWVASVEGGKNVTVLLPAAKDKSSYSLKFVTSTLGMVNYGFEMEKYTSGVTGSVLLNGHDVTEQKGVEWKSLVGLTGEELKLWTEEGRERVSWVSSPVGLVPEFTWHHFEFELDADVLVDERALVLDIATSKGFAWVNGNGIGRYYSAAEGDGDCGSCSYIGSYGDSKCRMNCGAPSQTLYHVSKQFLQEGTNHVVMWDEMGLSGEVNMKLLGAGTSCGAAKESVGDTTSAFVRCSPGTTIQSISFANFGHSEGECGSYKVGDCSTKGVQEVVEKHCLGYTKCAVAPLTSIFGDGCPKVVKTLTIQAECA